MAASHTGTAGSTVWCTDTAWSRVQDRARGLPKRRGRGAGGQMEAATEAMLRSYQDHMSSHPASDRACFVGSLIGYPGAAYSGEWVHDRAKVGTNKIRRVGERRQDGSRRVYLGPGVRTLLTDLVPCGLVLEHQRVQTRPTGSVAHPRDEDRQGRVLRTARPLSDVLLTAIVLETGPLPDGPMGDIDRQLLRQDTAQRLWTIAERPATELQGRDVKTTQQVLREVLPLLLIDDEQRITALRHMLPTWSGGLEALVAGLDTRSPRRRSYQTSLLCEQVPV